MIWSATSARARSWRKRKDAILDALADPNLNRGERQQLEAQHTDIKADIRAIKYGAPIHVYVLVVSNLQ